jgi:PAS domain S-box-containing protein
MRKLLATEDLEFAADFVPRIVWMSSSDRLVEFVNSRGTEYSGLPVQKLLGWKWILLVHPDDVERVRRTRDLAARTQGPIRVEFRLRRADLQFRWHYTASRPLLDEGGHIRKWIGTAIDIDEAKRTGADTDYARQESDEILGFLESLRDDAPLGLSLVDHEFRYLRINDYLAAANRRPPAEHIGRRVSEVVPELWPQIEPHFRHVFATGKAVLNVELSSPPADSQGEALTWTESYYPVAADGAIVAVGTRIVGKSSDPEVGRGLSL